MERRDARLAKKVHTAAANPLFAYTSGFAWNHDLPVFLTLAAVALPLHGSKRGRPDRRFPLSSGLLLGLAAGTRLSIALAIAPFLASFFFHPLNNGRKGRLAAAAVFYLGTLLGLLPSLYLFLAAPRQFIFGNFHYPVLNTAYRLEAGFSGPANPVDISEKLDYLWNNVLSQPGNLMLLLALLAAVYPLEGSAGIYPEFATGAFAWRTVPFLKAEQRSQLGIISWEELDGLLTRDPPAAILTGLEPLLEEPFVEYTRRDAYQWLAITEEIGLWIASSGEVP